MYFRLPRAEGVSPAVEQRLALEMCDQGVIELDPRYSLMSPVCGLAAHSLAEFLRVKRGRELHVKRGTGPQLAQIDRGFSYDHVFIMDPGAGTIIDPTPLQVLAFAGYHMDYITQVFPTPPEELVGDVRVAEFPNTPDGVAGFVDTMMHAVDRVKAEALPIRDKLDMIGGQPFLDMSGEDIRAALTDLWDTSHYREHPKHLLSPEYQKRITEVALALHETDSVK